MAKYKFRLLVGKNNKLYDTYVYRNQAEAVANKLIEQGEEKVQLWRTDNPRGWKLLKTFKPKGTGIFLTKEWRHNEI